MAHSVTVTAPAKVNLCLSVGPVRADGYHEVETVMHTLSLADRVVVTPADTLSVYCAPSVGVPDERNTAHRAAVAFGNAFGGQPRVRIDIEKRIPHEAGLGGGSSDAAAVIAALALMYDVGSTDPRCLEAARCVGADVAFFLHGACAHLVGRGDELVDLLPALYAPMVLVKPEASVSTAAAYAAFDARPEAPADPRPVIAALKAADATALGGSLSSNLEVAAGTVAPEISSVLSWLAEQPGVAGSLLAGSGSAAFALVKDAEVAGRMEHEARSRGWWACATSLSPRGLELVEGASE